MVSGHFRELTSVHAAGSSRSEAYGTRFLCLQLTELLRVGLALRTLELKFQQRRIQIFFKGDLLPS